jgi:thiol-disulfide isomerase/thioredoxin
MSDTAAPRREAPTAGPFLAGLLRDWGIALVVVLAVFAAYNLVFAPSPPELGPAPDFQLADLEGRSVSLSSMPHEVVVLNFWFTTCPPCRAEIPELTAFHAQNPDVGLYGVSTDVGMPPARLKHEADRLGIGYPVLHDVHAEIAGRYGIDVFPTTLVVRDGQIVSARVGAVDRRTLGAMVAAAR